MSNFGIKQNANLELKAIGAKIKCVAFDIDGVMTDGSLTFLEDGREVKTFNAKDGLGVVLLNKADIITSIITARDNGTVRERAKMLNIRELFEGQKNKLEALAILKEKYNLEDYEIAYMGDDLPDIPVIKQVGLGACPNDAAEHVQQVAKYVATKCGGRGAVREFCELILTSKGFDVQELCLNK
ncbi:HAD-IIIA family hydrolase [bacterium]|nr:HAD-IIIA family hydrolase [bacterium]